MKPPQRLNNLIRPARIIKRDMSEKREITFGLERLPYLLKRSKRKTIGFHINHDGLSVRVPIKANLSEIEKALISQQAWILKNINKPREPQNVLPVSWNSHDSFLFIGNNIEIKMHHPKNNAYYFNDDAQTFFIKAKPTEVHLTKTIQSFLKNEAMILFQKRAQYFAEKLHITPPTIKLSSAKKRWGSCNSHGLVRLNWRLIHLPTSLIDYVIAHELAHLFEMNHGKNFWELVKNICPNYKNDIRELSAYRIQI